MFDENGADAAPQTAERHEKPGDMEGTTAQHMRARAARDALETLAMESHCAGDWSLQRKTVQLTVCVVFLFVSQCMDAAHVSVLRWTGLKTAQMVNPKMIPSSADTAADCVCR